MDPPQTLGDQAVLPDSRTLLAGRSRLISNFPTQGLSSDSVIRHITTDLLPAFSSSSTCSNYYGFVTGGATPAARAADHIVVDVDQNVQVHLPNETIATNVEHAALTMLCQLLQLKPLQWPHRTFTTGATASNVAGLACGRQYILAADAAELGLARAMQVAGIEKIQVLSTVPHSSLKKAASVVGIGRASVIDVSRDDAPHKFDFALLEEYLREPKTASIVAVSCAEVNTGLFATTGRDMAKLRVLCDRHRAWLHVDAAFGALARVLPELQEYKHIREGVAGLELADSITGDAHKLLNVPYDCGFFFSKSLENATKVFQNPNAAYLSSAADGTIPSPLNIGLENSRRFRALPVYATLVAYGLDGYRDMLQRQVGLARAIANWVAGHPSYELIPGNMAATSLDHIFIVVLFRAIDRSTNEGLVRRINATRKIYISGTTWEGMPAARFAVANWQVNIDRDIEIIEEVLTGVLSS